MTILPDSSLPKFDQPPVTEMIVGVDFAELAAWSIPHFGLFWSHIRKEYQHCSANPPLLSQLEVFGEQHRQEITFSLPFGEPPVRCWYIDESQTWLIQIQKERFIQNWRKQPANAVYSHFGQVRARFALELERFQEFVAAEGLGDLQAQQCEVSYINHLELGAGQNVFTVLAELCPGWSGAKSANFLPDPEVVVLNTSYVIPDNRGRLRILLQPVFRHADAKELLQMTVSAKVIPTAPDFVAVLAAIDLGHEWAVRGFADFTSAKMHDLWKRRQ